MHCWLCENINISLYAAQSPKILAFEVAACTPTVYLKCYKILTLFKIWGKVVFSRIFRVFIISDQYSVYIYIAAAFGTANIQINLASVPILRDVNHLSVHSDSVLFRQMGRLRFMRLELISVIGIDSRTIAVQLPVCRNLNFVPTVAVVFRNHKLLLIGGVALVPPEIPLSVERHYKLLIVSLALRPCKLGAGCNLANLHSLGCKMRCVLLVAVVGSIANRSAQTEER